MEFKKILSKKKLIRHVYIFTKKWVKVHDLSGNAEDRYNPSEQIKFKTSML